MVSHVLQLSLVEVIEDEVILQAGNNKRVVIGSLLLWNWSDILIDCLTLSCHVRTLDLLSLVEEADTVERYVKYVDSTRL